MTDLSTLGARVAHLHDLYKGRDRPSLRDVDRYCDPPLSLGHTAQIVAGSIKDPGVSVVRRLARVFGCSIAWLGANEGRAPTGPAVTRAIDRARAETEQRESAIGPVVSRELGVSGQKEERR